MGHNSRQAATWRTTTQPSVRAGGSWRAASAAWIRKGGVWEQWWPGLPDRGGPYLYGAIAGCGPNVCRFNGSTWVSIGGGLNGDVTQLALDDTGRLLALGRMTAPGAIALWDGSTWADPIGGLPNAPTQLATSDGADFFYTDDVYTGHAQIRRLSDNSVEFVVSPVGFSAITAGPFCGYCNGTYSVPDIGKLMWPSGYTLTGARYGGARMIDGRVWGGGATEVYYETAAGTFTSLAGAFSGGYVAPLCAVPDGRVWAAGTFTAIDGVAIAGLAEWNGSAWAQIGAGLSSVISGAFHHGKLWILAGATITTRKVYTWDGSTLAMHSDWTGETVRGMV